MVGPADVDDFSIWSTEAGTRLLVARAALVMQYFGGSALNLTGPEIFDAWMAMLPARTRVYYVDYDARRFLRLTPKARDRVHGALATAGEEFVYFFFKDAPDVSLGQYSLELALGPSKDGSIAVHVAMPLAQVDAVGPAAVIATFERWVDAYPVAHASVGYGFDYTVGREHEQDAQPAMMGLARRYLGLDVRDRLTECGLREKVKGAAWLNYLSWPLIERAGGSAAMDAHLSPRVRRIECRNGMLLVAGERPTLGDADHPPPDLDALRDVAEFIKPIRLQRWVQDDVLRTFGFGDAQGWFARLDRSG